MGVHGACAISNTLVGEWCDGLSGVLVLFVGGCLLSHSGSSPQVRSRVALTRGRACHCWTVEDGLARGGRRAAVTGRHWGFANLRATLVGWGDRGVKPLVDGFTTKIPSPTRGFVCLSTRAGWTCPADLSVSSLLVCVNTAAGSAVAGVDSRPAVKPSWRWRICGTERHTPSSLQVSGSGRVPPAATSTKRSTCWPTSRRPSPMP